MPLISLADGDDKSLEIDKLKAKDQPINQLTTHRLNQDFPDFGIFWILIGFFSLWIFLTDVTHIKKQPSRGLNVNSHG